MHHPGYVEFLNKEFTADEARQIIAFLERGGGFSPNGETCVVSVFGYARDHGRSVADVLTECEREWKRNWDFQHPDLRADPVAPGAAGMQNRASLDNIYKALGIPNPAEEGQKIPQEPMVVRTLNSTYRFGKADGKGYRSIRRDEKPLPSGRSRVVFLAPEKPMQFSIEGHSTPWTTTPVQKISRCKSSPRKVRRGKPRA